MSNVKYRKYETIAEFFYQKASARIKREVVNSSLTHAEIYKPDSKQISRIINNNRQNNNPFLICDAVLKTSYEDEETGNRIPCGLVEKLSFSSTKEVLWGSDSEIETYIKELFMLLWNEICVKESRIDHELYLCDYIPYAKYSTYWNILFTPDYLPSQFYLESDPYYNKSTQKEEINTYTFPAMAFHFNEDEVIENIDPSKEKALEYLYNKCKDDFFREYIKFTECISSFHNLNKTIEINLVNECFLPVIDKYKPDGSSLGLRVRNLIYEDMTYSAFFFYNQHINNQKYWGQLVKASSEYIKKLEGIQRLCT